MKPLVFIVYIFILAVLTEFGARWWLDKPIILDGKLKYYQPHPFLSYELNPQHPGINKLSFRGDSLRKPVDIVVMGGSTTYCVKVVNDSTWPSQLAKMSGLSVLNAGVPGYTTAHLISLLALKIVYLKPKVILFHIGFNDLKARLLYSRLRTDYSNVFKAWNEPFYYRSYLLSKLIDGTQHINKIVEHKKNGAISDNFFGNDKPVFRENIKTLVAICRARKIEPVFLIQPTDFYQHRAELIGNYHIWAIGMAQQARIILGLSQELGFRVIDLRQQMQNVHEYYSDYIHMNDLGCKKKAQILEKIL